MSFELKRCLTSHKTSYAEAMLDSMENTAGKRFMIEMGVVSYGKDNYAQDENTYLVHYYYVHDDGRKELLQQRHVGTYTFVRSLYDNSLMPNFRFP